MILDRFLIFLIASAGRLLDSWLGKTLHRMIGIDLSPQMIGKCRQVAVYDELYGTFVRQLLHFIHYCVLRVIVQDIQEALETYDSHALDLIVSADV